jgi:hypothetical protein
MASPLITRSISGESQEESGLSLHAFPQWFKDKNVEEQPRPELSLHGSTTEHYLFILPKSGAG